MIIDGKSYFTWAKITGLGFSYELQKKLLPEPQKLINPYTDREQEVWEEEAVRKAMKTKEYKEGIKKKKKWYEKINREAEAKIDKLKVIDPDFYKAIKVDIVPYKKLKEDTINWRIKYVGAKPGSGNPRSYYRRWDSNYIKNAPKYEMDDWILFYISAYLTHYDKQWEDRLKEKNGIWQGFVIAEDTMWQKIADSYPRYSFDCKMKMLVP